MRGEKKGEIRNIHRIEPEDTKKGFIVNCLLFQSEEPLYRLLGVYTWLNILIIVLTVLSLLLGLSLFNQLRAVL